MKVLFLNPGAALGGAERSLLDLLASYRQGAPEVELEVIVGEEGALIERVRGLGIPIRFVPMPRSIASLGDSAAVGRARALIEIAGRASMAVGPTASYLARLGRAIHESAPDIVHSNGVKTHLFGALVTQRPLFWHVRDFVGERPLLRWILATTAWRVRTAIAISEAVRADVRAWAPGLHVELVENAIDVDAFRPEGEALDLDAAAGLPPAPAGTLRVGMIATYARWKGHDVFLDAVAELRQRVPKGFRAYVVGGPIYSTAGSQFSESELRARAKNLGLEELVGFVPFQDRPERAYRGLDIVVHAASRPEPFGRTVVEAMACGRPVVLAGAGGAAGLVRDGWDAVSVSPNDPRALADALAVLNSSPTKRIEIGERGRQTAVRRFRRERLGPAVAALHRSAARH